MNKHFIQRLYAYIFFAIALVFTQCVPGEKTVGEGPIVTQALDLDNIRSLVVNGSMDVTVEKGINQKIEVTSQQNIIDALNKQVKNGKWIIGFEDGSFSYSKVKIKATISELDEVNIDGSGNVEINDFLTFTRMNLLINGSGSISLKESGSSEKVNILINGSGNVVYKGGTIETAILYAEVSGSGDIDVSGIEANKASVTINGSGDVTLSVKESLEAEINGSGDIVYYGNPSISKQRSGSGDISRGNL